jgi:hypothetical protein
MMQLTQKTEQKSFQRVDVEELERLLKLSTNERDQKPARTGFFAMLKELFNFNRR